jgi:hypothetical protein
MVEFPTPGTYRIKSTNYGCYAGIRNFQGRDMLCGVRETNNKVYFMRLSCHTQSSRRQ